MREKRYTGIVVEEMVEKEVEGVVFSALETVDEREDLIESIDFQSVSSYLAFPLHLLPYHHRPTIHLSLFSLSLSLSLISFFDS